MSGSGSSARPAIALSTTAARVTSPAAHFQMSSSAFKDGAMLPVRYTCQGDGVSPPLTWAAPPRGAWSLALLCEDPDAPGGTFTHWIVYNLPATIRQMPEAVPAVSSLKNGAIQACNDFGGIGYGAPCPPSGTHRYFFRLYALDSKLGPDIAMNRARLLQAMKGHILAQAELMGRYQKH